MVRGLFVTGTDTSVGKTVVSAAMLLRYRGQVPLRYWKPIQTGIEQDDDTAEVVRLAACIEAPPLIDIAKQSAHALIVEGAGGTLVPINDTDLMADLMVSLGLPAMVVARSSLGTINHTLLTLEALRRQQRLPAGLAQEALLERLDLSASIGDQAAEERDPGSRVAHFVARCARVRSAGECCV